MRSGMTRYFWGALSLVLFGLGKAVGWAAF